MSFASIASLIRGSQPYFLYSFVRGEQEFLFTNKKNDISKSISGVTGTTWNSEAISHGKIVDSDQAFRSDFKITLPLGNEFAFDQVGSISTFPLRVVVWKGFLNDPDGEVVVQFVGEVVETSVDDSKSEIIFTCMTQIASLQKKGLSSVIQRPCRHIHYGRGCNLNLPDFQFTTTIASISETGTSVTLASVDDNPDGFYNLGILEWDGRFEMMLIHTGLNVTLASGITGLVEAVDLGTVEVKIAPGCPLSRNICDERFDNILNFGGFSFISDNPFDGRQLF